MIGRLAIDRRLPARSVIDLREDRELLRVSLRLIGQPIGAISLERDGRCRVERGREALDLCGEPLINDRLCQRVQRVKSGDLLVGVLHHPQAPDKPGIAIGERVADRRLLRIIDQVAGVQHIQRRASGQRPHDILRPRRVLEGANDRVDLALQTMIDQLLVTAQLRRVIATDRMMIERGVGLGERIIQVQHPIREIRILQDRLVGHRLLIDIDRLLRHEILVAEVTLVNRPEIDQRQDEQADRDNRHQLLAVLGGEIPEHQGGAQDDEQQRAHRVGRSQGLAVDQQGVIIPVRQLIMRVIRRAEIEEEARHQPKDQGQTTRNGQRADQSPLQQGIADLSAENLAQAPDRHDRHHQSWDDERHLDRPELIVHRQIMEHEIVERIEVATQGQKRQENATREQPPLHRVAHDEHTQYEQEADNGPEIDRSRGKALLAPIGRSLYLLAHLRATVTQLLIERRAGIEHSARAATIGVGYQERQQLALAVTPGKSVILIQAGRDLLACRCRRGQFRRPTDRALAQIPLRVHILRVRQDSQDHATHHDRRRLQQLGQLFRADHPHQITQIDKEAKQQEIIGDLHVRITDRERDTKQEDHGSPQMFPLEQQRHTRQRQRHIGDHISLRDMARLNDDQVIRGQGESDRPGNGQPDIHAHDTHQDIKTDQARKDHAGIVITQAFQGCLEPQVARQLRRRIAIARHVRHTAKHRVRPDTELARLGRLLIFRHLAVTHSGRLLVVRLANRLPLEDRRREIDHRQP